MRIYGLFIVIAVAMAFVAGALFFGGIGRPIAEPVTAATATTVMGEFLSSTKEIVRADFFALFPPDGAEELLDPRTALNHSHLFPYQDIRDLYALAQSCRSSGRRDSISPDLNKAFLWEEFRCGLRNSLPHNFFKSAPYVHPFGKSFAWLALDSGKVPSFTDAQGIRRHIPYFHVREYEDLTRKNVPLSRTRSALKNRPNDELQALLFHPDALLSGNFLLLRHHRDPAGDVEALSPATYHIFDSAVWQDFLAAKHPDLRVYARDEGEKCTVLTGNICWEANPDTLLNFINRYVLVIFLASVTLIGLALAALLAKIRQDKREEERRLFGLRTLTHELRTPVASLILHMDTLKADFDALSPEAQEAYLRLNSDVSRLNRLVEASRQYLTANASGACVNLNIHRVPSVNEQFECLLEPYRDDIAFQPLTEDGPFSLDCYWTGVCVKNLVENALSHGKQPVDVRLALNQGELTITVQDAGDTSALRLSDMSAAFHKGQSSQGYGLGLSLVVCIVKDMRGQLAFTPAPTRFTITLKDHV